MTLTLIIPAYNEEERLPRFLADLAVYALSQPHLLKEVLVVDDGSTDRTSAIAETYRERLPQLRLLRQPRNLGKGLAVQRGINDATADAVVFMDADGATPASALLDLPQHLGQAPIVVGNRWMRGAETRGRTPLRALSGWGIRLYMGLFGLGDVDTMCGFKGFQRSVALRLFNPLFEGRWLFDQEVLFRARRLGYGIKSIPVHWTSQRGSKVRLSTMFQAVVQLPRLLLRVRRELPSHRP